MTGFTVIVFLDALSGADLDDDPVIGATWRAADQILRGVPQGRVSLVRFWMGRESYQAAGPVTAALSAITASAVVADGVALAFNSCADAETLRATIDAIAVVPAGSIRIGNHETTLIYVDRRGRSAEEWIASIPVFSGVSAGGERSMRGLPLERDALDRAVRDALRDLHRPERLALNPLASTSLAIVADDGASGTAEAVRAAIMDAMSTVADAPGRALRAAYGERGRSHEDAAEAIHLPYGTFRRHVARGVEQLVAELWRREGTPRAK